MVGDEGFEPPSGGVKVRCLTAWLIPSVKQNSFFRSTIFFSSVTAAFPASACASALVQIRTDYKAPIRRFSSRSHDFLAAWLIPKIVSSLLSLVFRLRRYRYLVLGMKSAEKRQKWASSRKKLAYYIEKWEKAKKFRFFTRCGACRREDLAIAFFG